MTTIADLMKGLIRVPMQSVDAALKSAAILSRGIGAWRNAVFGLFYISLDESRADGGIRRSCRSPASRLAVEAELAKREASRIVARAALLGRIALQGAEDAAEPILRCCWPSDACADGGRREAATGERRPAA